MTWQGLEALYPEGYPPPTSVVIPEQLELPFTVFTLKEVATLALAAEEDEAEC